MNHASLFSGIGGFDLAAEWVGWNNIFAVEKELFCQKVLKKNFPELKIYSDIYEFDGRKYKGQIDIITGGFPCQPFSNAGKRKGENDDRYLWPQMLRVIREVKPSFVIGENVTGLVSMENGATLERIFSDLENEGYTVEPFIIPACSVEAWHRRDRIWIIAYSDDILYSHQFDPRKNKRETTRNKEKEKQHPQRNDNRKRFRVKSHSSNTGINANTRSKRGHGRGPRQIPKLKGLQIGKNGGVCAITTDRPDIPTPALCGTYNGIPDGVYRIKALGNAIVPQVAYEIFQAIDHIVYDPN